jgi:hypothetical protein
MDEVMEKREAIQGYQNLCQITGKSSTSIQMQNNRTENCFVPRHNVA